MISSNKKIKIKKCIESYGEGIYYYDSKFIKFDIIECDKSIYSNTSFNKYIISKNLENCFSRKKDLIHYYKEINCNKYKCKNDQ
jgi:hypothetical protein